MLRVQKSTYIQTRPVLVRLQRQVTCGWLCCGCKKAHTCKPVLCWSNAYARTAAGDRGVFGVPLGPRCGKVQHNTHILPRLLPLSCMGVSMGCCASRRLLDRVYCRSTFEMLTSGRSAPVCHCRVLPCLQVLSSGSLQPNQCQLATRSLAAYAVPVAGPLLSAVVPVESL
jgi:hypothetical protein